MTTRRRRSLGLALVFLLCAGTSAAQDRLLVDVQDLAPREMRMESFLLDAPAEIHIDAVGGRSTDRRRPFWDRWFNDEANRPEHWPGDAWILDARTREVVWTLRGADTRRGGDGLRSFEGTVALPAGVYEAYYASFAGEGMGEGSWIRSVDTRNKGYRDGDRVYWGEFVDNRAFQRFKLRLEGPGRRAEASALRRARDAFNATAIVSLTGLGNDAFQHVGFSLDRTTEIGFYALGEARRDGAYDYGWIIDADTHKRLWTMDFFSSDHGGGSDKNRVVRQHLSFPAGRYVAFFVTDDSHARDEWNASPPYDPDFWGLTLRVPDAAARAHVETFDYDIAPANNTLLALTRLGNHETRSEGFTLKRPMDVRIYALGEGREGSMYDYGWIMDARTRRRVWEMKHRDTEHAGGGQKNRMVDDVVSLDDGDYLLYFITDDSHAYGDWNDGPPFDQAHWGITLLTADGSTDRSDVTSYEETADPNILGQLTQIRDDARRRQRFTLDRDAEVRIYALGEGTGSTMHDYGWIEDADSGTVVWEMTYRMTDHAGGARKNRMADRPTVLKAGDYVLHYVADGSHAYGAWNAEPPHDPTYWGITVYRIPR